MVETLLPGLHRIEIPLKGNPLKTVNSYVVVGEERNLVIDTGLNQKECLDAMTAGLEQLNVDLRKTDFFITHLHADHFGLVRRLVVDGNKTYFNRPEKELVETWGGWEPMVEYAGRNGFPRDQLMAALTSHPGHKFGSEWVPELSALEDGDTIAVGDYEFRCLITPGHTPGHTCLYEPAKRLLVSGDHILIDITPNIQCWSDRYNPLKDYLDSLEKVYALDVGLVLPGHRRLFNDHRKRIDELRSHHAQRAQEVVDILRKGPRHAFDVASGMTWDINCDSWEQFPVAQKWFATGEAIAHLHYVEEQGRVAGESVDGLTMYTAVD